MTEKLEDFTFSKKEKLCSTKSIDSLFSSGESFIAYPIRVVYKQYDLIDEENQTSSVVISVSKRKFKRAVKRNRVKRMIREAYRLNKEFLIKQLIQENKRIDIAFIYLKDELPEYIEIKKGIQKAISLLANRIETIK